MVEPLLSLATPLLLCTFAEPVQAAVFAVSDAVPSALTAYGHYLGLVLVTVSLTAERLLIKPKMSVETEKLVGLADILYGVAGTLVVVTGKSSKLSSFHDVNRLSSRVFQGNCLWKGLGFLFTRTNFLVKAAAVRRCAS